MAEAELRSEADGFARAALNLAAALPGDAPLASSYQLTVDDVVASPVPGCTQPVAWAWSHDDSHLTCLWSPDGSLVRSLYVFEPATRGVAPLAAAAPEAPFDHAEVLRRERARERGLGVTWAMWAKQAPVVLLGGPCGLLACDGPGTPLRCVVASTPNEPVLDSALSPDGSLVAFARGGELHVAPTRPAEGGAPHPTVQLTRGAGGTVTHGVAEYIAQEELSRPSGFWWRDDGCTIAFTRVDDAPVPRYTIQHFGDDPAACETHAYPFAGAANAAVRLGVVLWPPGQPESASTVWTDLTCGVKGGPEEYLGRVVWAPGGDRLLASVLDRNQGTLRVLALCPRTGTRLATVVTEFSPPGCPWVNLTDAWRPLGGGALIWSSERTGFRHLYTCSADGAEPVALTSGPWVVDELEGVDEARRLVYFTASEASPLERHLYVVALDGTAPPRRLTTAPGMHSVVLSHGYDRFVDVLDSCDTPPTVTLCSTTDGAQLLAVWSPSAARARRLGLAPPELVTVLAADGVTQLHGALYKPPSGGPFPLVVSVYGGPHVQTVTRGWAQTVDMRAQLLRSRGFAVLKLDSRGSARRGVAFEAALSRAMGSVELADQAAGVAHLVRSGVADPARVAISGWSYGGYLAALGALRHPAVFRAAVAGAPVTSWDGYDTAYTERYMGSPGSDASSYAASSALTWPPGAATSPLLLVHGALDENVHYRHTARLVSALVERRAPHELMLFPSERHLPRSLAGRAHAEQRVLAFIERELAAGAGGAKRPREAA